MTDTSAPGSPFAEQSPAHTQVVLLRARWEPVDEPACLRWIDPISKREMHWRDAVDLLVRRSG
ncbi:hypothetical protein [Methylibium petroleiphilum]|uniref:hypothetical protein n=1 Tax=Methylibium petroleiphilum TaxID=105560 RepID=UPI00003CD1C7|nr:hypothetical protein [Methylibium petroleiphilum]